jgi:polyhydroxybutyrate depolymerase
MRITRYMLALLPMLGVLSNTWGARLPGEGIPEPGSYKQIMDIRVGAFRRSYRVHVPEGYDGTKAFPLVVVLHGAFSSAGKLEQQSGFSRLADQEGFLVVYPNGIGLFGLLRHWNSGHCCGKARKKGIDDVAFVVSVIQEVSERLRVDERRVYLVGHSNGGMLAHRFAAERAGIVAAIAPVSATIGGRPSAKDPEWRIPNPGGPVPMLTLHGVADEHVPFGGGRGKRSHGTIETISVQDSVDFWVRHNVCSSGPISDSLLDGRVVRQTWTDCSQGEDVVLYALEGWGHDWPGGPFLDRLKPGDPLRELDATRIIWDFLRRHRRGE